MAGQRGKEWLDADALNAELLLSHAGTKPDVQLFEQIDSTNAEALRQLQALPAGAKLMPKVLIARTQSAGRGRRGRAWVSQPGAGIYLSLMREFSRSPDALQGLSLVVGLSVQAALESIGAKESRLKWPNDILHRGAKLGGILLELRQVGGRSQVVIGIGINLSLPKVAAETLGRPIADLAGILGRETNREVLCAGLINQLGREIALFEKEGFGAFVSRWNKLDYYYGQRVSLEQGKGLTVGQSCGVDETGAQLVLLDCTAPNSDAGLDRKVRRFEGGELSPSLSPVAQLGQ